MWFEGNVYLDKCRPTSAKRQRGTAPLFLARKKKHIIYEKSELMKVG